MKEEKSKKKKKNSTVTVKANKKGRHVMKFMNFLRVVLIPIYYVLKPFRFYGNRKVPDGACVYVVNHYTVFDAIYPAVTTWEGIHYVAKKEIIEAPVLGTLARGVKVISVNRDGSDVRALLDCFKCLKNNEKIAIQICPVAKSHKLRRTVACTAHFFHILGNAAVQARRGGYGYPRESTRSSDRYL